MPEELETILRLVAEGKLSPDEASPIIDALTRAERDADLPPRRDRFDRRIERAGGAWPAHTGASTTPSAT